MDVRARSVLTITLVTSNTGLASGYHESLKPGVVCASEQNALKFTILESPQHDGFFPINKGLCRALPMNEVDGSTLFPVAHCILEDERGFAFLFGGWLNMLTVRFDKSDESQDLFCRDEGVMR